VCGLCCVPNCTFTDHAQYRAEAHSEIASDPANTCPLGPGRFDRGHLARIGTGYWQRHIEAAS
jgi:hypothetical protein